MDSAAILAYINCLRSSVKKVKLDSITNLESQLAECSSLSDISSENANELGQAIVNLLPDPSEKVRERAAILLTVLIDGQIIVDGTLPHLFSLLRNRLGGEKSDEESEEIRLLLVKLLLNVCNKRESCLKFHIEECITILERTLSDNFPTVRVESCQALIALITHAQPDFFNRSDPILDVLTTTCVHAQAKVRAANTLAIGYAIQYGNSKRVADVWRLLAQRVIDPSHLVRQSAFSVLHLWMTRLCDRYSHWHRFVPLLLSGLCDELSDVRIETEKLWSAVGNRYYDENRDDIKERNSHEDMVLNYPPDQTRPALGCRVLVQRVFFNILPSILNDLTDWKENVRTQSIRLLFQMLLHAEKHSIILLDKIIPALSQVAKDESRLVVTEVRNCARLIGHFVEPAVWCELLVQRMEDASHLVVLSGILQGTDTTHFVLHAENVLVNIHRLSHTEQSAQQFYSLECLERVINLLETAIDALAFWLFRIFATVRALAVNEDLAQRASGGMDRLVQFSNVSSATALYEMFTERFLTETINRYDTRKWLSSSLEHKILQKFLLEAGLRGFMKHFKILYPVMKENVQANASLQIRFDIYRLIIDIAQSRNIDKTERSAQVDCQVIPEFFFPNMTWKAGRSNVVARAACCTCLAVLFDQEILDVKTIGGLKAEIVNKLVALSRDECQESQRAVARLSRIIISADNAIAQDLQALIPVFLKGLDESKEVRCECLAGIREFFEKCETFEKERKHLRPQLEEVCRLLLIHMEDPDPEIAAEALDCLKSSVVLMKSFVQKLVPADITNQTANKHFNSLKTFLHDTNSSGDN